MASWVGRGGGLIDEGGHCCFEGGVDGFLVFRGQVLELWVLVEVVFDGFHQGGHFGGTSHWRRGCLVFSLGFLGWLLVLWGALFWEGALEQGMLFWGQVSSWVKVGGIGRTRAGVDWARAVGT